MRQVPNFGQSSGSSSSDRKKSVFDRLGRQLETGSGQRLPSASTTSGSTMRRRPSPSQYGDYMQPPLPMHENYSGRDGPLNQAELDWRYQNRTHMPQFMRDRPPNLLPQQPPPHMQSMPPPQAHYEMDMGHRQQPPYYPGSPYNGQCGDMPPNMQQRSSPKYDRHGNVIPNFKGPAMLPPPPHIRMEPPHHQLMPQPSRGFMPPMMQPGMHPGPNIPQEMMQMRSDMMYGPRWQDDMEPEFAMPKGRMMQEDRFSPSNSHRFQQQQQMMLPPQQTMLNLAQMAPGLYPNMPNEIPRYTKWKERRDVITTLDRETAQSSSRTDSLKSSLQQPDSKSSVTTDQKEKASRGGEKFNKNELKANSDNSAKKSTDKTKKVKTEPQDISDGEIIDDEDSSDGSLTTGVVTTDTKDPMLDRRIDPTANKSFINTPPRNRDSHKYFEPNAKKRRLYEREDYSTMDYETISDDDLDVYMGDKKDVNGKDEELGVDKASNDNGDTRSLSEIELLNALGLDWANLVELAKQSKTSCSKDSNVSGSALTRFLVPNYLHTLGITPDLAGHEIYELITKVCRLPQQYV